MRERLIALCALGGMVLAGLAWAGAGLDDNPTATIARQKGGGVLSVSLNGPALAVVLTAPAWQFTGFDHAPATPEETARLAGVLAELRAGDQLFPTPPEAWCRMVSAAVSPPDYSADGPAMMKGQWGYQCGNPAALQWIEARVMDRFPALDALATTLLAGANRKNVVLTPGVTRALMPRSR